MRSYALNFRGKQKQRPSAEPENALAAALVAPALMMPPCLCNPEVEVAPPCLCDAGVGMAAHCLCNPEVALVPP